jgi:hypothetical protein
MILSSDIILLLIGTKMDFDGALAGLQQNIKKMNAVTITLPNSFGFKEHRIYDFDNFINFFDWTLFDVQVKIDLRECNHANYQAFSLLVLYAWKLKSQRCRVSFIESDSSTGASEMYRLLGARGTFPVLMNDSQNFLGNQYKPLFAVRTKIDFTNVIAAAESYTGEFNVEFTKTLRYVLSELLYNTLEHGQSHYDFGHQTCRIPSLCQFSWYQNKNEVSFIIADSGVGIKKHLEQAYPGQESDAQAILKAMKPQVSGTFGKNDPYKKKDNAGMGIFLSTNIIRKLNAEMHIVSGNGLVHVSPRDVTNKTLKNSWPGTFVLVTIKLDNGPKQQTLLQMMQEFREAALIEQRKASSQEEQAETYYSIFNYFGSYAEDKEAAINFRDSRIFDAMTKSNKIILDFDNVVSIPHSFLSALLASPVKTLGIKAYKVFKIVNATPDIRETIDFIMEENTE